ncbi:hypothetical protein LB535_07865 [Mesorhizobium sp. CA10]|nr:hypothetical protein [Mesorhizobium sp. CA10]MBZ9882265.1 hypothetical protein [Mesorhizobium sp. CA10]
MKILTLAEIHALAEIDIDIGHRLIEMTGKIILGNQRGGCVSFDRLGGLRMLLRLVALKRQLVFERHLDRVVEIGVERRLACGLHGLDGVLTRVSRLLIIEVGKLLIVEFGRLVMVELEILVQRSRHFPVDRKIIFDRRDIERTGDGLVEIVVESDLRLGSFFWHRREMRLRCKMRLWRDFRFGSRLRLRRKIRLRRTGHSEVGIIRRVVEYEILLEGSGKLVVIRGGAGSLEGRLFADLMQCSLLSDRRAFLDGVELAHQLLLEVDVEIVSLHGLIGLLGRGGRLPHWLARIETHDPGQFSERIIVGDVVVVGYFQRGSVCHYCSRTRTQSDAMDVAQGWPLPAQCGQKVTGFLVKPNAFRWARLPR